MVAKNIHGLLAKRAGTGSREHREPEKATNAGEIDAWAHNSVFSIYIGGHGRDPGVGVLHVEATKALGITLVGACDKAL